MDLREVGTTDAVATEFRVPWKVRDALAGLAVVLVATILAANFLAAIRDGAAIREGSALIPIVFLLLLLLTVWAAWFFGIRKYGAAWTSIG